MRSYDSLRSARWFTPADKQGYTHRERIRQIGLGDADFKGKPVIGILSTWSKLNPCHIHMRERADDVRRGVLQAGGVPLEIPVMSLGEPFMRPTTMLYRDLLSIEVEEVIRCHPLDGVVLMGGCDKTTPAMLLGALSAHVPAVFLPAGPMLTGRWRGKTIGSGTDANKAFEDLKAGVITQEQYDEMEAAGARSAGHCMTMGTASTMTSLAEAMGMTPVGSASIPAPDSRHRVMAARLGRLAVDLVWRDVKPADIMTADAFHNGIVTLMSLGGSTNAVIHLLALADRAGVPLSLDDFERIGADVPVLADMRPSGRFLMEDFYYAGGLPALMDRLSELKRDAMTVTGQTLGAELDGAECFDDEVIRPRSNPLQTGGGLMVLRGNLAPEGALIKVSAANPDLLNHRGRAVVFKDRADLLARIDSDDLDVTVDDILVLQNAGPKSVPGMPEWGMLPIPKKLAKQGVRDMLRISDARMSGTHYGTIVLHVTPEAALGGPLALVRDGDMIELNIAQRSLTLDVSDEALAARHADWRPPEPADKRGWPSLFRDRVGTASTGAGLDFLSGPDRRGEPTF